MLKTRSQAPAKRQPAPQPAVDISCEICGRTFSRRSDKTRHINGVHRAIKDFPCPQCDKRFAQKTGLVTHISMFHDKKRPWPCRFPACDSETKTFGDRAGRGRHEREKHGTPGYLCRDCGDGFRRKITLAKHVKADHPGEWETYTDEEKADQMTTDQFYVAFLDPALAAAGLTRADVDGPIEDDQVQASGGVDPQPQSPASGSGRPGRRSTRLSTRRKINMTEPDSDVDAEGEPEIVTEEDIYAQPPPPQLLNAPLQMLEPEVLLDHAPSDPGVKQPSPLQLSFTAPPAQDPPLFFPPPLFDCEASMRIPGAPTQAPVGLPFPLYCYPPFHPSLAGPSPYGNPLSLNWGYAPPPMHMMMPGLAPPSGFSYHHGGVSLDPSLLMYEQFGPAPPPNTPTVGPSSMTPTSTWTTRDSSPFVPTPTPDASGSAVRIFRDDALERERVGVDAEFMKNIDPALLNASCRD